MSSQTSLRNTLRVLTLNLWQRYGAWADRRSVLIDGIRAKQPDLVAFAESIKTDEYDQTVDLLGEGFNVAYSKARDTNGMGISIASRWPVEEVREVDLNVTSRTAGFPCTALVARVAAPDPIGSLLFGTALDIAACERIFDEPVNGIWASDHFGLVADLAHP